MILECILIHNCGSVEVSLIWTITFFPSTSFFSVHLLLWHSSLNVITSTSHCYESYIYFYHDICIKIFSVVIMNVFIFSNVVIWIYLYSSSAFLSLFLSRFFCRLVYDVLEHINFKKIFVYIGDTTYDEKVNISHKKKCIFCIFKHVYK